MNYLVTHQKDKSKHSTENKDTDGPDAQKDWPSNDNQIFEIVLKPSSEGETDVSFGGGKILLKIRQNSEDSSATSSTISQRDFDALSEDSKFGDNLNVKNLKKLPPDLSEEYLSVGDISERFVPAIQQNAKFPNQFKMLSNESTISSLSYQSVLTSTTTSGIGIENSSSSACNEVIEVKQATITSIEEKHTENNIRSCKLTPVFRKAGGAEKIGGVHPIEKSDNSSISISINLDDLQLAKSMLHSQENYSGVFERPYIKLYPQKLNKFNFLINEIYKILKCKPQKYTKLANTCLSLKTGLSLKMEDFFGEVLRKKEVNQFQRYTQIFKAMDKLGAKHKEKAEEFKKLLLKHTNEELCEVKLKEPLDKFLDFQILLDAYNKQLQENLKVVICESIQLSLFEKVKFPGFSQLPLTKNTRNILKKYYELMSTGKVSTFEELVTQLYGMEWYENMTQPNSNRLKHRQTRIGKQKYEIY